MNSENRVLNVFMNGLPVGKLTKTKSGILTFQYEDTWLSLPGTRPVSLSLPLSNKPFKGDLVYNYFDNLLPDNEQIRARIQALLSIRTNQAFDILEKIGKDCVGAVQLLKEESVSSIKSIEYTPLHDHEIASILQGYRINPLGMSKNNNDFRISIAGAQEKTALLWHNNQWCLPLHSTPTTHILKLPIGNIVHQNLDLSESCENEWLCAQLASAFGLPVAPCEIQIFEGVKALVVERFDRQLSSDKTWIMRLPQEDMCQALGISSQLKYQADGGPGIKEIMKVLLGSNQASVDRDIFFRSQIFFWLLAAPDGHAKNFSVFIEPNDEIQLTPLYDILSAYPLIFKKQLQGPKLKMAMALQGKNKHYHWIHVARRHFIETARISGYSTEKMEILLDSMLDEIDSVINKVSGILPKDFPDHIATSVFDGMREMGKSLR
jgi:serine/threonine-protein kinase HipA